MRGVWGACYIGAVPAAGEGTCAAERKIDMSDKKKTTAKKKKSAGKARTGRKMEVLAPDPSLNLMDLLPDELKADIQRDVNALFGGGDAGKPRKKQFSKKPKLDENGEEKKCFICGATSHLVRTPCCGKWICDDADQYVMFSYARNSCYRNHSRFTLCGAHYAEGHKGDWKTCKKCRKLAEPEMVAWYGTNEYNWEKMPDPPAFKPTLCSKCGKRIVLPDGGYAYTREGYVCEDCHEW